jgi:uncharacterized membrane protein YgcG
MSATVMAPAASEDAATAVRRAHDAAVAGTALLEAPASGGAPRRPATAVHRAAAAGHPWLQRLPFAPHAAATIEPALLACVRSPELTYEPAIPRRLARSGVLSELQLEALLAIGRCHAHRLDAPMPPLLSQASEGRAGGSGLGAQETSGQGDGGGRATGGGGGSGSGGGGGSGGPPSAEVGFGGVRAGFLLADGPGVGKGRTQAAAILDAWLQGFQRAVW